MQGLPLKELQLGATAVQLLECSPLEDLVYNLALLNVIGQTRRSSRR